MLSARSSHSFAFAGYSSDFDMDVPMRLDVAFVPLRVRSRCSGLRRSRPAGLGASLASRELVWRRNRRTSDEVHPRASLGSDLRRVMQQRNDGRNGAWRTLSYSWVKAFPLSRKPDIAVFVSG